MTTETIQPRRIAWTAIVPLAVFLSAAIFMALGLRNDPHALPSTMIDRPMPNFELTAIAPGKDVLAPEDLRGQVSLINVFGSWCSSCVAEHPTLMDLAESSNVPIYGVDWRDKPGAGQAWLDRYGDPYTLTGVDGESRLAIELGVTGAPETFLVDADGQIRYKHIGPITPEVWADIFVPLIAEIGGPAQ